MPVIDFNPYLESKKNLKTQNTALMAEALEIKARFGPNPYSDFLMRNQSRPDPETAKAMGLALAYRVRASDGEIYPADTCERTTGTRRRDRVTLVSSNKDAFISSASVQLKTAEENWAYEAAISKYHSLTILTELDAAVECLIRIRDGLPVDVDDCSLRIARHPSSNGP